MLLVLSLDGICWQDVDLAQLPNLRKIALAGTFTERLATVFPSVTWNIHTTVATGKLPKDHGILGNAAFSQKHQKQFSYYDPAFSTAEEIQSPTIFESLKDRGLTTAAICWPLTQGSSQITYNIPEFYHQAHFDAWSSQELAEELVQSGFPFEKYADWSCSHELAVLQDDLTCSIMEYLIKTKKPDVLFGHFLIHDSFQHHFGICTAESKWAMHYCDQLVGRLLHCIEETFPASDNGIIVFSDHGHESVYQYIDLQALLSKHKLSAKDFTWVNNGGAIFFYCLPTKSQEDNSLCKELQSALESHPGIEKVVLAKDAPSVGLSSAACPDTFPALIACLNEGWLLDKSRQARSMHGYDPSTHPRMDGFMVRQLPAGQPGTVEKNNSIVNIYQLIQDYFQ